MRRVFFRALNTMEVFNTSRESWKMVSFAAIPRGCYLHSFVAIDNKLLVLGGRDATER